MTFSISAKIQDGSQNFVLKINAFLHFTQKFKMAAKNGGKEIFVKCRQYTLQIPCVTNFIKIAVSQTVSKINAFLRFPQKFKMAAKNCRKKIFVKSHQSTLQITCRSEIFSKSLYLERFPRLMCFAFYTEIQNGHQKNGGKVIFAKCRQYTLEIPCGSKIFLESLYLTPFAR